MVTIVTGMIMGKLSNNGLMAHLALFAVSLIYGANYTIAKEVLSNNYIQPLGFILIRVISGVFFFGIIHQLFIKEKTDRKDIPRFMLCALFGVAINQIFFFSGLQRTFPINASLLMMTTPILVLIISAIVLREAVTMRKILGIVIGCVGALVLITYGNSVAFSKEGFVGDIMILINALSYGIYLVLVKTLMQKYHPVTVVKWVFFFGFFMVFPFGIKDFLAIEWSSFPTSIWYAVAYVLIGATWMAYLFNAYALSKVNASVVSSYIYLQPLIAAIIAISFGKDLLTTTKIFAGIAIFIGVYLVSFHQKTEKTGLTNKLK